jgi:uncharacterized protein YndB with AHSA1/START domain
VNPATAAGLVTREVRTGSRDGAATRIVIARRSYPTSQADLWDAVTNPERIPRWFLPVSGDLRPGGRYQLDGNAGGVIERCHAPESFAVTWEFGGTVTWLTVTISGDGSRTTLQLAHEEPAGSDKWRRFGPGAVGVGWDLALMGLELHLDSGARRDPNAAATFPVSPEGRAFISASASGWAEAATAAGEDPAGAQEAAARTLAFYTGAPGGTGS